MAMYVHQKYFCIHSSGGTGWRSFHVCVCVCVCVYVCVNESHQMNLAKCVGSHTEKIESP